MEDIHKIKLLLTVPQDIVILSHRNPDGDAVGSSFGLYHILKKLNHKITVIFPSEFPTTFEYLSEINRSIIYDLKPEESKNAIEKASVMFFLDFNAIDRIDRMAEFVLQSNAKKILIDHHIDTEPIAQYYFSDTEASSTSELVYKFINDLGFDNLIGLECGECLFTGIITDTGSFKYGTRPYTYEVAAKLKMKGVDDYYLQNAINNNLDEKHLRLLGHCLANRMEVLPDYGVAIIWLTKDDYVQFSIQRGDTEGIVNYMLMMKSIKMAAFITEQPSIVKLSLRSKDGLNVQEIAANHFNGGGHKNASGGSAYAKLEDVINRLKKIIPNYIKQVNI